jgi:uncharacterized protein (TIGR00369 family)
MEFDQFVETFKKHNEYDRTLGLDFEIIEPGHIKYQVTVTEKHVSSPNIAHGGFIASIMDSVLGFSALTLAATQKMVVSTVEFKLNMVRPAKVGDVLVGEGRIDHEGKSLIISTGRIFKGDKLVAQGQGTFNKYPMQKKEGYNDEIIP